MKYKTSLITILWGSLLCFTLSVVAQNSLQYQKTLCGKRLNTPKVLTN